MTFTVQNYKVAVAAIILERINQLKRVFMPDWLKLTVVRWLAELVTSAPLPLSLSRVARWLHIEFTITKDGMTYRRAQCWGYYGAPGLLSDVMKDQRRQQFWEARIRCPEETRRLIVASHNTPRIRSLLRILKQFPAVIIRIDRYGFFIENLKEYPVLETRRCTRCGKELTIDRFPPVEQKRGRPERVCKTCRRGPPTIKTGRRRRNADTTDKAATVRNACDKCTV